MECWQPFFLRMSLDHDRGVRSVLFGQQDARVNIDREWRTVVKLIKVFWLVRNVFNSNYFSFSWKNYVAFWLVVGLALIFLRFACHVLHIENLRHILGEDEWFVFISNLFLCPLLSSHTGLSLRRHLLGSPIGIETNESSRGHSQAPIFSLWHQSSCPYFHHGLLHQYAHHYFGSCSFHLGLLCKMYIHWSHTLVLDDCGR